jgi:hypothetical protein
MRRADFRKEGILNEANIQIIYENKKKIINNLLKINSVKEFLLVFDDDQDGFLNEDEQILVFTIIAKRIQVIAEELCQNKKYELFKDLMKEVRNIESQINKYQNELRQNVHKKQLDNYIEIGKEMQNEFNENWDLKMMAFQTRANKNIEEYQKELKEQLNAYYQTEASKIHALNLKPNHQIRLLSNQEKLVANNERVEEAVNFRNELVRLVKKDNERLERTKQDMLRNLNKKINKSEKKEMNKITDRLSKERDNLFISRNKETDVLNKKINLHISDIVRIQNSLSNMYLKIGAKDDELYREKQRQKKTNETLAAFKSIKKYQSSPYSNAISNHEIVMALLNLSNKPLSLHNSMDFTGLNKFGNQKNSVLALKYIMKTMKLTRFDINSEFNSRKFCNVSHDTALKGENNLKKKIRILLEERKHKDEIMIPPSLYYDNYLEKELDAKNYRQLLPKIGQ